ncbi:MAG: hypothetical protein Q4C78_00180 [Synergistaceae bacterium]|nr:hypothetical protein [Synergistaceae bacterium]
MEQLLAIGSIFLIGCLGSCLGYFILRYAKSLTKLHCDKSMAKIQPQCFHTLALSIFLFLFFAFFIIFYRLFGISPELFVVCLTFCVLFFHACTDYLTGITFDLVTYTFVPCLLLLRLCFGLDFFLQGLYSMLMSLGVMLLIFLASRGKSGAGDVFVASCLGCGCFGVAECTLCLYLSFLFGAIVAVALLVAKKITRKTKIPFAPFLFIGYAMGIVLFYVLPNFRVNIFF